MNNQLEKRFLSAQDLQVTEGKLSGYAIVFNSLSEDLGGFRERVLPMAVDSSLASDRDIWAYAQHDSDRPIGRRSKGTLRLEKDEIGLKFEIDLPDTTVGRDLAINVARQDVGGMSFGFIPVQDRYVKESGDTVRELIEVQLHEISVVTHPAYRTVVSARAIEEARAEAAEELAKREAEEQEAAKVAEQEKQKILEAEYKQRLATLNLYA